MGHIDFAESIRITQKCHICTTDWSKNYTIWDILTFAFWQCTHNTLNYL